MEEGKIPGAQPPSCLWGCLKPPPVLLAAKAFAWEKTSSHFISPAVLRDLKLESLATLAMGTKLLRNEQTCVSLSVYAFSV